MEPTQTPPQTTSLLIPAHPLAGREEILSRLFQMYSDISESRARLDVRSERNAVSFDKLSDAILLAQFANTAIETDTAQTEAEQTTSPGRTGTPEATIDAIGTSAAGIATSNQAVATSLGNLASALVPIVAGTSGVVSVQTLAAVLAAVVASAGAAAQAAARETS